MALFVEVVTVQKLIRCVFKILNWKERIYSGAPVVLISNAEEHPVLSERTDGRRGLPIKLHQRF